MNALGQGWLLSLASSLLTAYMLATFPFFTIDLPFSLCMMFINFREELSGLAHSFVSETSLEGASYADS